MLSYYFFFNIIQACNISHNHSNAVTTSNQSATNSNSNSNINKAGGQTTHFYQQRTITQKFFSSRPMANFQSRNLKMMSLTIMLVSCIFILLTLPIMLFIVIDKIDFVAQNSEHQSDSSCKSVIWALVNVFMYVNHSINFVLYCLTGSKFRTELATLFVSPHKLLCMTAPELNSPYMAMNATRRYSNRMMQQISTSATNLNANVNINNSNSNINNNVYALHSGAPHRSQSFFLKTTANL